MAKARTTTSEEDEDGRELPPLAVGDPLERREIAAIEQHFTEPPPRYTEASLIKKMEELGIGRPSTYAATIGVLQDRDYVELDKKRLIPQDHGRLVTAFLESFFRRYVEYGFTADLEEKLDLISDGELDWKEVLRDFWKDFAAAIAEHQGTPRHRSPRRAQRTARPAHLPGPRRWRRSAPLPDLRHRTAVAEDSANSAPSSAARTIRNAATPGSSRARPTVPRTRRARAATACACSARIRTPAST